MVIAGFQPMSLIDYPGVISSIVFTQGCVFRCSYCHNPELVPHKTTSGKSIASILEYLEHHAAILEGVTITGGEPTLHPDLIDVIREIKRLRFLVKLDTNGISPHVMEHLFAERLVDYVAMDIKHLWQAYPRVIGLTQRAVVDNCRKTFDLIQTSGIAHEFRTTIAPHLHTEEDIVSIASMLKPGERYALQHVRYEKTLDPDMPRREPYDLPRLAARIREHHPTLEVIVR